MLHDVHDSFQLHNLQCNLFNIQLKSIFYFLEVIIQPLDYQEAEDGCG